MRKIIYALAAFMVSVALAYAQESDSTSMENDSIAASSASHNSSIGTLSGSLNGELTKEMGDSAYIRGDYPAAIEIYEGLLQKGESATVYYNLGNSYYKNKDIARAILNYERAHLLNPGNSDIKFNLEMARSKTVDKVDTVGSFFLAEWYNALRNCYSTNQWAGGAVACFILLLASVGLYIFGRNIRFKKIGFSAAVLFLILTVLTNIFASQQKNLLVNRNSAIIMSPSVTVKSTPDAGGTELFILHEGHKVSIKDASMKEWREIQLEDGSIGWVPKDVLEVI